MSTNYQSSLVLNQFVQASGVFPPRDTDGGFGVTLGMIRTSAAAFGSTPNGLLPANGTLLSLSQNTALFSLLGIQFGGNGSSNFALPNLTGNASINFGQGPGLGNYVIGQQFGAADMTLTQSNLPASSGGTSSGIANHQPTLTTNYFINAQGLFPSQGAGGSSLDLIGMVFQAGYNFPVGIPCDGRLLSIADYSALFAVIGTTYGGDGVSTFAVPDLRGRTIIGQGNGLVVGQTVGGETTTAVTANMPTTMGGSATPLNNRQPGLVMSTLVALNGFFQGSDSETPNIGEVVYFAGSFTPSGYAQAQGQILPISGNQALFSLLGTTYGGNGTTNFALPDLRGRAIVGAGNGFPVGTVLGSDTVTIVPADIPALNIPGTAGADTLFGGNLNDVISGQGSADILRGNGGNDTIDGGDGDDTLDGGDGDDTLISGTGTDTVLGGVGNDAISFGANLTAADTIDGGTGTNDQVGISGNYTGGNALVLGPTTLTNVEVLAVLPGAGNSYNITTNDANVAAGQELTVFAGNLAAGQNFTFNGSGETNGSFRVFGGLGTDTITGGALSDGFYFGPGKWQAGDSVSGGGGTNDQLALDGNYAITIGANADVETLALLPGPAGTPNSFTITLDDAWVGAGVSKIVWGGQVTTALTINGSAETGGNFTFFGGIAGDTLTGGAGSDSIWGGAGNDAITGGLGTDFANYAGARATYSVVTGGGNVQIVDNNVVANGNDGTDTLVGIEFARFSDQTISITSPIILDLDGGGVETLSASASSARFDMDGDGVGDDTSWFGRGEGLLFLDRNGDGTLSNAGEMSFTGDVANARSDLEGLRAWDSNGDGQLSSADARFRDFKIWRDRDGDGVVDRREVMTLRQAGVRSLSLTGTAVSGTYALGDTAIVNTGSFTRTNGRQGGLIDAVLTAVSSKAEAEQRGTVQAPAASIDRSLLGGSFDDALASLSNGGGRDSLDQRAMPITTALTPERAPGGSSLDAGELALASATPLTVIEHGNMLFDSLDARLALMTQDMAAFGPTRAATETDRWRREGAPQVDMFAA